MSDELEDTVAHVAEVLARARRGPAYTVLVTETGGGRDQVVRELGAVSWESYAMAVQALNRAHTTLATALEERREKDGEGSPGAEAGVGAPAAQ